MATVTIDSDFGAQENKICHCFIFFPSICCEVMGLDAMILVFWVVSFKPTFSLYFFTFIKRLFSSPSFSAIRVVSSAYLRLLIFLPNTSWDRVFVKTQMGEIFLELYNMAVSFLPSSANTWKRWHLYSCPMIHDKFNAFSHQTTLLAWKWASRFSTS